MNRIFCIIGKSGSGKDTLYNEILLKSKLAVTPIIPYTTRPKRHDEVDGVNYNFVTEQQLCEFEAANRIIEKREYHTILGLWTYFTLAIDLKPDTDYLLINTLEGAESLIKKYGQDMIYVIYLTLDERTRLMRCINREARQSKPNYAEVCRRYPTDDADFSKKRLDLIKNLYNIRADESVANCLAQWESIITGLRQTNL